MADPADPIDMLNVLLEKQTPPMHVTIGSIFGALMVLGIAALIKYLIRS